MNNHHDIRNIQFEEVIEGPYRIIYHIQSEQIDVVVVIHSAINLLLS
jgi:plasmid stabilization system protein ParE